MKVSKTQALKAINGATADEVYNALDFSQLPVDTENNLSPTLDDVIEALSTNDTSLSSPEENN